MPAPTFGSHLRTFVVTVPDNTGAYVTLLSLLSAAQLATLTRTEFGPKPPGAMNDSSPIIAAQVTLRPGGDIYVSYKAWASAGAAAADRWSIASGVAEEYPLDDALRRIFVQSQGGSTQSLEIRLFAQPTFT
jgi:hypothetical protein